MVVGSAKEAGVLLLPLRPGLLHAGLLAGSLFLWQDAGMKDRSSSKQSRRRLVQKKERGRKPRQQVKRRGAWRSTAGQDRGTKQEDLEKRRTTERRRKVDERLLTEVG